MRGIAELVLCTNKSPVSAWLSGAGAGAGGGGGAVSTGVIERSSEGEASG